MNKCFGVVLSDVNSTDDERTWFYLDARIQGKPCAFSIETERRTVGTTPKTPLSQYKISAISAISAGHKKRAKSNTPYLLGVRSLNARRILQEYSSNSGSKLLEF